MQTPPPHTPPPQQCDQINLSVLSSLFCVHTQRTTADLCGRSERLNEYSQATAFFCRQAGDRHTGGPFVLMKVKGRVGGGGGGDTALKCVLDILNSTPDTLKDKLRANLAPETGPNGGSSQLSINE